MNFFERVYEVVKGIPSGTVMSYGQIAKILLSPHCSRQVGWALHVNPEPGVIPCHRVVDRFGRPSKAFAFGGENKQVELLKSEGVEFDKNGCVLPQYFALDI